MQSFLGLAGWETIMLVDLEAFCRGFVPFPSSGVQVQIRPADVAVGSASGEDPQLVNIDCTGLGGHDLGGFKDYDICLRTDKHSQSIYGPSVTPLESPGRDGTHQVTLVALGGSKAMHEFLVLHYLATDSAREWDVLSGQLLTLVHMGTGWQSTGDCPTYVRQVPHCPIPQTVCTSLLDCGNEVDA